MDTNGNVSKGEYGWRRISRQCKRIPRGATVVAFECHRNETRCLMSALQPAGMGFDSHSLHPVYEFPFSFYRYLFHSHSRRESIPLLFILSLKNPTCPNIRNSNDSPDHMSSNEFSSLFAPRSPENYM